MAKARRICGETKSYIYLKILRTAALNSKDSEGYCKLSKYFYATSTTGDFAYLIIMI